MDLYDCTKELSDFCNEPLVTGLCRAAIPVFGYKNSVGKCVPFTYGGCRGNENRFDTIQECETTCLE